MRPRTARQGVSFRAGIVKRIAGAYVAVGMTIPPRPAEEHTKRGLIGAILAVLDDRNLAAALRVLTPARENRDATREQARCARCVTRGE